MKGAKPTGNKKTAATQNANPLIEPLPADTLKNVQAILPVIHSYSLNIDLAADGRGSDGAPETAGEDQMLRSDKVLYAGLLQVVREAIDYEIRRLGLQWM